MIYVGIDIAKLNHFASAIDSDGQVLIEPFEFLNDNDGFYTLVSKLDPYEKDKVIIGLESTAHYGNNLLAFLVPKGYNVCLINPIETCTMRKNKITVEDDETSDNDEVEIETEVLKAEISVTKTSVLHEVSDNKDGKAEYGDSIVYTITATNDGTKAGNDFTRSWHYEIE